MGIIIRQSVKNAVWSYLGIVIGYINVGIIMPQFFDTAQIGLVQLFASVSLIFAQFGTLGFTSVINRLFPVFRNPQKIHNGFLFLALATGMIGFVLSVGGFFLLKPWIIETNIEKSPLLVDYLLLLLPLVFMRLLFSLLDNYNKILFDSVTGTFWLEFMHKVLNLVLIILFAFGWLNFSQFFYGYLVSMSIPVFPVIYVLIRRHHFSLLPHPEFLTKPLKKEIGSTMFYGFINGLAVVVVLNIDKVFVNQYLSLDEVGIFGVCALFASLIRVPYASISKIATGIIAEAWQRNDKAHIMEIYQKAALNQTVLGVLIFIGILSNMHNIFSILPPVYATGKWVLVIYSTGVLVNTILGMAGNITETSAYYRLNTVFVGLVLISQLLLSFWLIPRLGINGAAIATASTLILGALYPAVFQRIAFRIYGVSLKLMTICFIGIVSFALNFLLPRLPLISDVILRSSLVTIVFVGFVVWLKVSPDFNLTLSEMLMKIPVKRWLHTNRKNISQ
jgi:O-antigen/teichoic acid export membrane protein